MTGLGRAESGFFRPAPPRGPALAGVHAPRPARRGRLLADMIASGIVLGLVLRLFLQAHVSAGEEAALGPTPAHPSACEDSEIPRPPQDRPRRLLL